MAVTTRRIHGRLVSVVDPDVGHLAVADMENLGNVVVKLAAFPLGAVCNQHHNVLVVGKDVVQLRLKCAHRKREHLAEYPKHLSNAFVIAGEWVMAGEVPAGVLG